MTLIETLKAEIHRNGWLSVIAAVRQAVRESDEDDQADEILGHLGAALKAAVAMEEAA